MPFLRNEFSKVLEDLSMMTWFTETAHIYDPTKTHSRIPTDSVEVKFYKFLFFCIHRDFLRKSSRFASKTKIHPTDSQQELQTEKSKETLSEEKSITDKPSEILSETESTGVQSDAYIKSSDIIF